MHRYSAYGLTLETEDEFPELELANRPEHPIQFVCEEPQFAQPISEWFYSWTDTGDEPWLRFANLGQILLLRYPGFVDFEIAACRSRVVCRPHQTIEHATVRHLFLDQVLPLMISGADGLALHASAVVWEGRSAAFLGPSGAGKSTLASALCARGAQLLADDCVRLRHETARALAMPAYSGLRLWPDAARGLQIDTAAPVAEYTAKLRVSVPAVPTPQPLTHLLLLEPGDEIGVSPLAASESLQALLRFTFVLDVNSREMLRAQFEAATKLVSRCAFSRLTGPRVFTRLDEVCAAIRRHVCG